jgi:hypothetical protein
VRYELLIDLVSGKDDSVGMKTTLLEDLKEFIGHLPLFALLGAIGVIVGTIARHFHIYF